MASLDSSLLDTLGGLDTTARLDARKSLSSSQFGRGSFVGGRGGGGAPGTGAKKMLSRQSMAPVDGRCVVAWRSASLTA